MRARTRPGRLYASGARLRRFAWPLLAIASILTADAPVALAAESAGGDRGGGWALAESSREGERSWRLYTRKVEGSRHLRYRIESAVDVPPETVLRAALRRVEDDAFLPRNQRRRTLRRGDSELISYLYLDVPFVTDRDVVVRMTWSGDPDTGAYRIVWQPTEEGPAVEGDVVRIRSQGFWEFLPEGHGGTRLVYEQHSELGDSVPQWLVDRMMNGEILNELHTLFAVLDQDEALPAIASPPRTRAGSQTGPRLVPLDAASALTR